MVKKFFAFVFGFFFLLFALSSVSYAITPLENSKRGITFEEQQKLQDKKIMVQDRLETIKSRNQEFNVKIASFSSELKKKRVETISEKLNQLNQNRVGVFTKYIEKLQIMIERIKAHIAKVEAQGGKVEEAKANIARVEKQLASVLAQLETQKTRDYTPEITGEARAKTDIQATRKALHTDLTTFRKELVEIKQQLMQTLRLLKQSEDPKSTDGPATGEGAFQ